MSVYSASSEFPRREPARETPPSALARARDRVTERGVRRLEAVGQRAEHRVDHLGPAWHVVGWPRGFIEPATDQTDTRVPGRAGFLAIGPGGVFAVTVVNQGRSRIMLAGDVVQVHGRRPPYVPDARRVARRVSAVLTAAVGTKVPVVPVLAFVGSGVISMHGLPKDCLVATHKELDRLLAGGGERISAETAAKLSDVASRPDTWADQYRWYAGAQTAGDKRPSPR
jgi:hypothetical protein